jgi:hypothetical protein
VTPARGAEILPPSVAALLAEAAALDADAWSRAFAAWSSSGTGYGEALRTLQAPAALGSQVRRAVAGSLRDSLGAIDAADPRTGVTTATTLLTAAALATASPGSVSGATRAALFAPLAAAGITVPPDDGEAD